MRRVGGDMARAFRTYIDGEERLFSRLPTGVEDGHRLPDRESYSVPEDALVAYGWLNPVAWRNAHSRLRFELVRTQTTLVSDPQDFRGALPIEVTPLAGFDEQARWLFDRCSKSWGAAVVRDHRFLNERFGDAPGRSYLRLGVRDHDQVLRGYAILSFAPYRRTGAGSRPFGARGQPTRGPSVPGAYLADWLVPFDEPEVGRCLHDAIQAYARARHIRALVAVMPEWSRWFGRFQEWSWIVEPSDRLLAVLTRAPRFDMHWLRDHWWYQWAESHLV